MDIVKIFYKYINRFINGTDVIEELKKIDTSSYSKKEVNNLNKLISDLENTIKTIPNEIDDIERNRVESLKKQSKTIRQLLDSDSIDDNTKGKFQSIYADMLHDLKITKDGGKLYTTVFDTFNTSDIFKRKYKNMSTNDMLELITSYFQVPCPPNLSQEEFDELVTLAIKDDKREALFRLAFNYEGLNKDYSKIEDYYIEKRDAYFLTELVHAVKEDLDVDNLLRKVIATRDRDFMADVKKHAKQTSLFNDEDEWKRLIDLANKIDSEYK